MNPIVKLRKLQISKRVRKLNRIIHTGCVELFNFNLFNIGHSKKVITANVTKCPCTVSYFIDGSFLSTTDWRLATRVHCDECSPRTSVLNRHLPSFPKGKRGPSTFQSSKNLSRCSGVHVSVRSAASPRRSFFADYPPPEVSLRKNRRFNRKKSLTNSQNVI